MYYLKVPGLSRFHFQGRQVGRFSFYFYRGKLFKISVLIAIFFLILYKTL